MTPDKTYSKTWITCLILCCAFFAEAQDQTQTKEYRWRGYVYEKSTGKPADNVYVVNHRSHKNTISNQSGYFEIMAKKGDSLIFSNISFEFLFLEIKEEQHQDTVWLKQRNYLLEEVNVSSYHLTSNRPKEMKLKEPLVPDDDKIREQHMRMEKPGMSSPADILYYYFGKQPKQLRQLQELYQQDEFKRKLQEGSNREIIMEITGLSKDELEAFMFFCKYSRVQIDSFNDYVLLTSLLDCYKEYQKRQEMEKILREQNYWEE